jgi:hypothetical protein
MKHKGKWVLVGPDGSTYRGDAPIQFVTEEINTCSVTPEVVEAIQLAYSYMKAQILNFSRENLAGEIKEKYDQEHAKMMRLSNWLNEVDQNEKI